jgi:YHS domain-containing protein
LKVKVTAMKTVFSLCAVVFGLMVSGLVIAESGITLEGIKCIVSGAPIDAAKSVDYAEGKAYFCCGKCSKKFEDDKTKFVSKANAQLVATKQYEQGGCPFSGGKVNPDTMVKVAGAEVGFCCNNCKGKVEKMKDEEKLAAVFSKEAFEKAKFVKVEKK